MTTILTLSAGSDRNIVACEVASQRMIEWTVAAAKLPERIDRAPLNIALILDRSGSMQGEKLRYVKQAAKYVLEMLDERDRVALVAYDDEIQVIAPSTPMTAGARSAIVQRLEGLQPGGWTNLSEGWFRGCQEVANHIVAASVNRALLLTDGLANRGITDLEGLTHHARELRRRGITTSTFGVGLDFNEHLLEGMAAQGGGSFCFIERPEQIPDMFKRELGDLLAVVAREAFLSIGLPSGVGIEPLGDLPHERVGERLRIFLGDLYGGEQRTLYTRALLPPDAPGTSVAIRGELGFADRDGLTQTVVAELAFSYAREVEVRRIPVAEDLLARASAVELATAAAKALRLERSGDRVQAQAVMNQAIAASAPYAPAAAAQYNELAAEMEQGLSEEQRKRSHFEAYQKRQSRKS
ncbi:MAG: VWA domain-containing protein [Roseiflexaceae bacterium]